MKKNIVKISLDSRIYNLEVILNTCYQFIDHAYIFLDTALNGKKIIVFLKNKQKKLSLVAGEQLKGEFENELLFWSLRRSVSNNNKKIREYIVGHALLASLSASDLGFVSSNKKPDYTEDPLGIAVPWEEKYGSKKKQKKQY